MAMTAAWIIPADKEDGMMVRHMRRRGELELRRNSGVRVCAFAACVSAGFMLIVAPNASADERASQTHSQQSMQEGQRLARDIPQSHSEYSDTEADDTKTSGWFVTGHDGVKTWVGPLARNHITGTFKYPTDPPVGGPHNPVLLNCNGDVYTEPVRNENAVHSLEHGAVWVT